MGSEDTKTPGASAQVGVGSPVWVEDAELAWVEATAIKIDGGKVTSKTLDGNLVITDLSDAVPRDEDVTPSGVDDMTKLSYLHEPGVLHNLFTRYKHDEIYTYTGNILIAVNPFRRLPHLFNKGMMQQYKDARLGELSPHVYAVADAAYKAMIDERKSQSILVSGESGAGKTETTKQIMQYLAFMGGRAGSEGRSVERQVLQSNPLLEAFGNAKTVRNNNSSRFGKFVEIQFNNGKISGAAVRTYLLESTRVTQISDPERNYHCFYQLCAGASPEDATRLKLGPLDTFHYLNQSKCVEVATIDDVSEYNITRNAMDVVGINTEDQDAIFRIIAGILHLGNIDFSPGKDEASSQVSSETGMYHLKAASEMLLCDEKMLEASLTTRIMVTRGESIIKLLDTRQATDNRDAFARTIYAKLFDWLVDKVNKSIGQDPLSTVLVGVLDIYGFESFDVNSFEQFCINLTNEKLQQHFNTHVFKMEQEEYRKEAINWDNIDFVDNIDVLDLIEKKPVGIIALLDEACMFPRSTAESFASKLGSTFQNHKRFSRPKFRKTAFTIDHYAGQVEYRADFFLEKNKDYVVPEHQKLLYASKCPFVSSLFPPPEEGAKPSSKFSSIGSRFKMQLASLMETLNQTQPHYIRCVKPNMKLKPQLFENKNVLQQLRCSGVLEAVRISCAGFPTRRTFFEFLDRFGLLYPEVLLDCLDEKGACENLLEKCALQGFQIGKTKVFLRAGQMAILDTKRTTVLNDAAEKIQRMVRTFLMKRDFQRMKEAALLLQSCWRGTMARLMYKQLREEAASICIQRFARGFIAHQQYTVMRAAAIRIQSTYRSLVATRILRTLQRDSAAKQIQSNWRGYVAAKRYNELLRSCVLFQCAWRRKEAKVELRKLRQAARETGALREAKNRLEKQCEELTLRLQLEKRMRLDFEHAKHGEVIKLQLTMEEMQSQVEQMKVLFAKEREAHALEMVEAKKAADQVAAAGMSAQASKEAMDKIESLTQENENLQKLVAMKEKKAAEKEAELEEKKSMLDRGVKKIEESESKLERIQEILARADELVANLESENQVLRQQVLKVKEMESENQVLRQRVSQSGVANVKPKVAVPVRVELDSVFPNGLEKSSSLTPDRLTRNVSERLYNDAIDNYIETETATGRGTWDGSGEYTTDSYLGQEQGQYPEQYPEQYQEQTRESTEDDSGESIADSYQGQSLGQEQGREQGQDLGQYEDQTRSRSTSETGSGEYKADLYTGEDVELESSRDDILLRNQEVLTQTIAQQEAEIAELRRELERRSVPDAAPIAQQETEIAELRRELALRSAASAPSAQQEEEIAELRRELALRSVSDAAPIAEQETEIAELRRELALRSAASAPSAQQEEEIAELRRELALRSVPDAALSAQQETEIEELRRALALRSDASVPSAQQEEEIAGLRRKLALSSVPDAAPSAQQEIEIAELRRELALRSMPDAASSAQQDAEIVELRRELALRSTPDAASSAQQVAEIAELRRELALRPVSDAGPSAQQEAEIAELRRELALRSVPGATSSAEHEAEIAELRRELALRSVTDAAPSAQQVAEIAELRRELANRSVVEAQQEVEIAELRRELARRSVADAAPGPRVEYSEALPDSLAQTESRPTASKPLEEHRRESSDASIGQDLGQKLGQQLELEPSQIDAGMRPGIEHDAPVSVSVTQTDIRQTAAKPLEEHRREPSDSGFEQDLGQKLELEISQSDDVTGPTVEYDAPVSVSATETEHRQTAAEPLKDPSAELHGSSVGQEYLGQNLVPGAGTRTGTESGVLALHQERESAQANVETESRVENTGAVLNSLTRTDSRQRSAAVPLAECRPQSRDSNLGQDLGPKLEQDAGQNLGLLADARPVSRSAVRTVWPSWVDNVAYAGQDETGPGLEPIVMTASSIRRTESRRHWARAVSALNSGKDLGHRDSVAAVRSGLPPRPEAAGASSGSIHMLPPPLATSRPAPRPDIRADGMQDTRGLVRVQSAPVQRQELRVPGQGNRAEFRVPEARRVELKQERTGPEQPRPNPRGLLAQGRPPRLEIGRPMRTPDRYPDERTPRTPEAISNSGRLYSESPRPLERAGHVRRESVDSQIDSPVAEAKQVEQKKSKMLHDKLQNDQEALLQCVVQDVGFSNDHPVAAVIIFRSLLHWHSFEAERTNVFDRIINAIQSAIESHSDHNDVLAYWLSNTSTLLYLLQRTLKASGGSGTAPQRRRQQSLFGRMTQGFRTAQPNYPNGMGPIGSDNVRQVEAKYPALLFKQQLTAYVEKIYGMVRDNLKKEITPLLGSCIQAPRAPRQQFGRRNLSPAPGQQVLSSHWGSIINSLLKLLNTLRGNKVPPYLVKKIFTQIFSFINVQLFNSLLLRRECCSFSNGEYIKAGLAQLEHWIYEAGEEYAGASWEELRYIRQAVGFLVIHQKPKKSLDEITHDLCPALSIQQLYRISTMYWDDKYGTHTVAPEVIQHMRVLMTEDSNSAMSNSFLLDDDSAIPFSVDDISKSMPELDLSEVHAPPLLKEIPSFRFLLAEKE